MIYQCVFEAIETLEKIFPVSFVTTYSSMDFYFSHKLITRAEMLEMKEAEDDKSKKKNRKSRAQSRSPGKRPPSDSKKGHSPDKREKTSSGNNSFLLNSKYGIVNSHLQKLLNGLRMWTEWRRF